MKSLKAMSLHAIAGLAATTIVACVAQPPEEESATGASSTAIVNGTPQALGENSFVRLPAGGCTGTLLTNQWVLTADHCATHVGDAVLMDSQSTTVASVVQNPRASSGVDLALLHLASPLSVGGKTTGFLRNLRSDYALPGGHTRCFGYGKATGANDNGIDVLLRLMELKIGGFNGLYLLVPNALNQSAALGDAGGACLDDAGAVIGLMHTYPNASFPAGDTLMVPVQEYSTWANITISRCTTDAECWTGICNKSEHACVTSRCFDGVKDNGEGGIDCGGSCAKRCPVIGACPSGMVDCYDGHCVKYASQCP